MEQNKKQQICCISDELPPLSSSDHHPWLVAHNLDPEEDDTGDQVFYTLHDPMSSYYRCRIPELVGRSIRGCFHGWMILSKQLSPHNIKWSLWNPLISKSIYLPHMTLKDGDDLPYCCLSSPPDDDPDSILLLMGPTKPNIVYAFCNDKRQKRLRGWTEISCSKQLKNIIDSPKPGHLLEPTCCNGNIYVRYYVNGLPPLLIQVQITKEKRDVIFNLVPLVNFPWRCSADNLFLKGSCTQLFTIRLFVDDQYKPCDVYLYKLDMGSMVWTEIKDDLKDTVFFVSLADNEVNDDLVYSCPPIASELGGGYIHFLEESGDEVHSYNIKDKTISISSMRCLGLPLCKSLSIWTIPEFRSHGKANCRLDGDHDQMVTSATTTARNDDEEEVEHMNEAPLLNMPFDVLENIMKFCVGVAYLNFRATCKLCRLAAPIQTYSSASPWLMVLDKDQGIITFTTPMYGDNNYVIKASPELFYHDRILCSRHGWLLLYIADRCIAFFNPFTTDIRKLPFPVPLSGLEMSNFSFSAPPSFSFSAPPTSPDCMVVAFSQGCQPKVFFHRVGGEPSWYTIPLDFRNLHHDFCFPTFCGEDVYTVFSDGGLDVFRGIDDRDNFSRNTVVDQGPITNWGAKCYQVKCDQHHLLVIVEEYGESVKVFKLNGCTREWEEIDCLGRHMIYICDTSCVCMDAKIPEMENKIYFPRLHSDNGKIVFYSLETCRFHTFNGRNVEQNLTDLFGTKQTVYAHAWIEPTWS